MVRKLKTPGRALHPSTTSKESGVSAAFLRALFDYDAETGVLRWKVTTGARVSGTIAGRPQSYGYWRVTIHGVGFPVHRIAWCMTHGEWPNTILDHVNGEPGDNRIANLRLATPSENNANVGSFHPDPSHLRGTRRLANGRWQATISKNRKLFCLGCFDTPEEAHAAYAVKAGDLYGEYTRV